jgi:hypothetical protein
VAEDKQSPAAIIGRHLHRGLEGLQYAGAGMAQAVDDRAARWALRHKLGALMIGRTEAGVLHLDQGHPLTNVLYVGHPARRELYYPAAEFHRRVFEHKFVEAVTLLTSLGASRIAVQQEEGETRDRSGAASRQGLALPAHIRNSPGREPSSRRNSPAVASHSFPTACAGIPTSRPGR